MKSKIFRILGVATTVAMLVSMLTVAPLLAVSTPIVVLTAQGAGTAYTISHPNIYTTTFNAGAAVLAGGKVVVVFPATTNLTNLTQSAVSTGGAFRLPDIGQSFTITDVTGGDSGTVVVTAGTIAVTGTGTWTGPGWSTAATQTIIVTATAANTVGTWTRTTNTATAALTNKTGTGATSNVMMTALTGIGGGPIATDTLCAYAVTGTYPAAQTLTITVPASGIGSGSLVQLILGTTSGIGNPSTAGDFTFTVATQTAASVVIEAAVPSASYTIINPVIAVPPGLVKLYNASGVLLSQDVGANKLEAAVLSVTTADFTIELGPGTYIEDDIAIPAAAEGLTIKATGSVADTIVPARWTVSAIDVTFQGLTLRPDVASGTTITVGATADNFTVDGCAFTKFQPVAPALNTSAETFINYGNTTALGEGTIKNCAFDSTLDNGSLAGETNIVVGAAAIGLTISKNTFKLDLNGTTYASDYGISTAAVPTGAVANVTITENTFTGYVNFGKAIKVTGGLADITNNTFTGVMIALETTSGTAKAKFVGNTVTNSGYYSATTTSLQVPVFRVTNTGGLKVYNNKITGSKWYVAQITAGDTLCFFNLNDLSSNAHGIRNDAAAVDVDATHNWWGSADGPATDHNTDYVNADYPLGAAPSNGVVAIGLASLSAKTTTGVVVNLLNDGVAATVDAADMIGIAAFSANPAAVAVPSVLTGAKYFDVFVLDADGDADTVRVMFYGSVTSNSQVWFYSNFAGTWVKCSDQSINTTSGFIVVDITVISTPSIIDLLGTPFILVEAPPAAPGSAAIPQSPALGAMDVAINASFTWPAVAGAVRYDIEIASESGQTTDKFYLKDDVGSSEVNAYKPVDNLLYDTQYWWRVRAVNNVGVKGAWTTAFFTTEEEPAAVVEPPPPVVIEQGQAPVITLEIPPADKIEPIPAYLLWAVIAVGAVLVIAVIVLIVRTRRIS